MKRSNSFRDYLISLLHPNVKGDSRLPARWFGRHRHRYQQYVYAYGTPGSRQGSYHIHFNDGRINVSPLNDRWRYGSHGYWEVVGPDVHLKWTPIAGTYIGSNRTIKTRSVPLWVPWVIVAIPTALLFWLDRRRIPSGYCKKCGYDLTGNVSGVCPECGEMVPPQQSA